MNLTPLLNKAVHRSLSESDARDAALALMTGEVDVLGNYNYLEVWNHERFLSKLNREPLTDDDLLALAEFGI